MRRSDAVSIRFVNQTTLLMPTGSQLTPQPLAYTASSRQCSNLPEW